MVALASCCMNNCTIVSTSLSTVAIHRTPCGWWPTGEPSIPTIGSGKPAV
jgi:hypothetical protein